MNLDIALLFSRTSIYLLY